MSDTLIAVLLALAAGMSYATAAVLQQRVAAQQAPELSLSLAVDRRARQAAALAARYRVRRRCVRVGGDGARVRVDHRRSSAPGQRLAVRAPTRHDRPFRPRHAARDGAGGHGCRWSCRLRRGRVAGGRAVTGVAARLDPGRRCRRDDRQRLRAPRPPPEDAAQYARVVLRARDGGDLQPYVGAHEVDGRPLRRRRGRLPWVTGRCTRW